MILGYLSFILLTLACSTFGKTVPEKGDELENKEIISQELITDLNNDGISEKLILVTGKNMFNSRLVIMREEQMLSVIHWESGTKPIWKVAVGDIDNDGMKEIAVGLWKYSWVDNSEGNRLSLYNWDGRSITAKWRGSTLSKPFYDFAIADVDGDNTAELITLEKRPGTQEQYFLVIYHWTGFGFSVEWQNQIKESIVALNILDIDSDGKQEIVLLNKRNADYYEIIAYAGVENQYHFVKILKSGHLKGLDNNTAYWYNIPIQIAGKKETLTFYRSPLIKEELND